MSKKVYDASTIQFIKNNIDTRTSKEIASFLRVSPNSINSYIRALRQYASEEEIIAYPISTKAFSEWANLYGTKGEPKYLFIERDHKTKEKSELQMTLNCLDDVEDVTVTDLCEQESVAMDEGLKHDIKKAKRIADYISRDPDILSKAISSVERIVNILNEILEDWRSF